MNDQHEPKPDPFACCRNGEHQPVPDRQPSDAAVEAAAQELFRDQDGDFVQPDHPWLTTFESSRRPKYTRRARAALEAAYRVDEPRPALDRDQIEGLVTYFLAQREGCEQLRAANEASGADLTAIDYHARAETWQSAADAVLALLNGDGS